MKYPVVYTDGTVCDIYECETLEQAKDFVQKLYLRELDCGANSGNIKNDHTNAWVSFNGESATCILIGNYKEIPNLQF